MCQINLNFWHDRVVATCWRIRNWGLWPQSFEKVAEDYVGTSHWRVWWTRNRDEVRYDNVDCWDHCWGSGTVDRAWTLTILDDRYAEVPAQR